MSVLIVEDDKEIRTVIELYLSTVFHLSRGRDYLMPESLGVAREIVREDRGLKAVFLDFDLHKFPDNTDRFDPIDGKMVVRDIGNGTAIFNTCAAARNFSLTDDARDIDLRKGSAEFFSELGRNVVEYSKR